MDAEEISYDVQPSKRKLKKLYAKIKKQMEFYFSDSNLAKDKFLYDLVTKDPDGYVDLEIFKSFNKIKALTDNIEVIVSAVSRSSMFEISKDQKRVRRVTPIQLSKDFDACTLYVERLPQNADQKWVKDVFGHFGCVCYVNVPRFKATTKIKGFAFVEFDDPESVKKACEFYKIVPEKECSTSEDESKNAKCAKKHKHDEATDRRGKRGRTRSASESEKLTDFSSLKSEQSHEASDRDQEHDKDHHNPKAKRKRKREDSGSDTTSKKLKDSADENMENLKSDNELKEKYTIEKNHSSMQPEDQIIANESNKVAEVCDNQHNESELEESKIKRKRKNSKKHRSNAERPSLRVMPKSEWKTYRNKYLEIQRSTMSILKKQILFETQELKEQECSTKASEITEAKKPLQFQPGVIIKVNLSEPVKKPSDIKDQVKANVVVAYIDAPVESSEIFIRCHNSEEAQAIIKEEKLSHLGKAELLKDDDEKSYWDKIEAARKLKFSNPVPHKKRGRDKLLAKAIKLEEMKNKHIYFDE